MRAWLALVPVLLVAGLTGCEPAKAVDASKHNTNGRYQFAGKREYSNGTEIYYIDTMKGRACYAFITNDEKPDTNRCTDSQAVLDGDGL